MSDPFLEALRTAEQLTLETRGRRTGRPHRVDVWFAFDPPDLWLRTDRVADWQRNLEHDPWCRVTVAGLTREARREPVEDEDAALRKVVDLWRAKYGPEWVADWYVERGRAPVLLHLTPS